MAVAPSADHDEELAEAARARPRGPHPGRPRRRRGSPSRPASDGLPLPAAPPRVGRRSSPWTPLVRDLRDPVEDSGLRVEVVGPDQVEDRVAVQLAAFDRSTFTTEKWHEMAQAPAYALARCLLGYDARGNAVAAVTVWSAGPGRPGLLEPMGVHRDHRGHGHAPPSASPRPGRCATSLPPAPRSPRRAQRRLRGDVRQAVPPAARGPGLRAHATMRAWCTASRTRRQLDLTGTRVSRLSAYQTSLTLRRITVRCRAWARMPTKTSASSSEVPAPAVLRPCR